MFERGIHLYFNFCLCIVKEISKQLSEEIYTELDEEEDITMNEIKAETWRGVDEDGKDKNNIYALRWEVYKIEKDYLIKTVFLVFVPHPKGGDIFWTFVKDNIIE